MSIDEVKVKIKIRCDPVIVCVKLIGEVELGHHLIFVLKLRVKIAKMVIFYPFLHTPQTTHNVYDYCIIFSTLWNRE